MANIFPNFKSNVWVRPTGGPPAIIRDGNTVGWYLSDKPDTITKDGSDRVSEWADFLGSGHDLLQATGADQMLWSTNGILGDGISEFLKTVGFGYSQPEMIYIVFRQVSWTIGRYFFDGNGAATGIIYQKGVATPDLKASAGSPSGVNSNLAVNTWGIARVLFNGASSTFQINQTAALTGNFGAANMSGFTLGSQSTGNVPSNIEVKEVILRKIADTAGSQADIYNYLSNKHSI